MMIPICPVCGEQLTMGQKVWQCRNGHCFDVARQGYVNLLTVDKKHSLHPGDTRDMVIARRDFLNGGYYRPIAGRLCELLQEYVPQPEYVLDAGCGEGYYLTQVGAEFPAAALWGLDISKEAVRCAAVRSKAAHWITGTAAALPFAAGSFDCLLSMFALTVPEEFARVLRTGGIFVQVLAGEDHLMSLKQLIYPTIIRKEKKLAEEYLGFTLLHHETLKFDFSLEDNRQVLNLLSMTPHYWRISKEGALRLAAAQQLKERGQVVFNIYGRR